MKRILFVFILTRFWSYATAQQLSVVSPNGKVIMVLSENNDTAGKWQLGVRYNSGPESLTVIPVIQLGLVRNDQAFCDGLKLVKKSKPVKIVEGYTSLHGKSSERRNEATEYTCSFKNKTGTAMDIILRAYNDGIAFRYSFPQKDTTVFSMTDELTAYQFPDNAGRWLQSFVTSYEGFYKSQEKKVEIG